MATDPNRIAGTASVTIDGQSFTIVGEGTYRLSAEHRETLKGQSGIEGYSAMPMEGKISWKGRDGSNVDIDALNNATNATVVLTPANGKSIIARNAWRSGDPIEVNTEDGSFSIEFDSPDVIAA